MKNLYKRMISLSLSAVLALSGFTIDAKGPHHGGPKPPMHQMNHRRPGASHRPVYINSRPTAGFAVNFGGFSYWVNNGSFYQQLGPSRYQIVRPPIGVIVPRLYKASHYHKGGVRYFVSNGVIYEKYGPNYRVVGYR